MAKVECSRVLPRLRGLWVSAGRHRQPQPPSRESLRNCLKGNHRNAVRESQQRADSSTKRVARQPHVRVGIELCDVGVELASCLVVAVLVAQGLHDARVVARVCAGSTVANLMPGPGSLLGAATAEEQIVVDLVVGRRTVAIENRGRGALQADDDRRVRLIRPHMAAQPVAFPSKISASVVVSANLFPVRHPGKLHIGIRCHVGQTQNSILVGDVGRRRLVHGPSLGGEDRNISSMPRCSYHRVYHTGSSINKSLDS